MSISSSQVDSLAIRLVLACEGFAAELFALAAAVDVGALAIVMLVMLVDTTS